MEDYSFAWWNIWVYIILLFALVRCFFHVNGKGHIVVQPLVIYKIFKLGLNVARQTYPRSALQRTQPIFNSIGLVSAFSFLFQFCDIKKLVIFSQNVVKFTQENHIYPKFSIFLVKWPKLSNTIIVGDIVIDYY
jgi:hypothetical protein